MAHRAKSPEEIATDVQRQKDDWEYKQNAPKRWLDERHGGKKPEITAREAFLIQEALIALDWDESSAAMNYNDLRYYASGEVLSVYDIKKEESKG